MSEGCRGRVTDAADIGRLGRSWGVGLCAVPPLRWGREGGRPHSQVTCAFPELCPPSCGSHFSPSRAPRGGKDYVRLYIVTSLINCCAEYITWMLGWMYIVTSLINCCAEYITWMLGWMYIVTSLINCYAEYITWMLGWMYIVTSLINCYAEYITWMLGWMKHKLESRWLGEIQITSDMQMTPPLWQKDRRN